MMLKATRLAKGRRARSISVRWMWALVLAAPFAYGQSYVQVSRSNPRYLELSTGEPYLAIGPNIAFERYSTDDEEVFARTERRFRALSENGGNFARIWLSNPFYELDPDAPRADIDLKLKRIERLLALGAKYRLKLKLCLAHFRTFDGTTPQSPYAFTFVRRDLGTRFGTMNDFWQGEAARDWYKRKLDLLASRFANDPTVFGWELWNEINAVAGEGWEDWTRAMLPELKRRFPHHLALQSLGSFDAESSVEVYRRFSTMPGSEIAQVHRYLDPGARFEICHAPIDVLASDAVTTIRGYTQDRPVLLAETGAVEPRHSGPSKLYEIDRDGVLLHDGIFAPFFAGAAGPGHFWHWTEYIERNNLWWHYGRFVEAVRGIDPRAEGFTPVTQANERVRIYELRGSEHTLMWVRDKASDWHSELVEGKPAATLSGVTVKVLGAKSADVYDPWTGRHTTIRVRANQLTLPEFRRSVVIRVETRRARPFSE